MVLLILDFSSVMGRVLVSCAVDPGFQWFNGKRARLWCCRSWVSLAFGGMTVRVIASGHH
jgi:hypothetical protein